MYRIEIVLATGENAVQELCEELTVIAMASLKDSKCEYFEVPTSGNNLDAIYFPKSLIKGVVVQGVLYEKGRTDADK
ncbi:MAG: hypothetical protein FWE25_03360 [Lachnospiraceae bacterium]|nr:hypothetical protein [Lachnospiraceae bacterium]